MARKKKASATHLDTVDLQKLEILDTKKLLLESKKEIEEYKLKEFEYKERIQQQQLRITHYEKVLQKQAVTAASKLQDDLAKAKQEVVSDLVNKYELGTKWGYDDISGEIFRDDEE